MHKPVCEATSTHRFQSALPITEQEEPLNSADNLLIIFVRDVAWHNGIIELP